MKLFLIFIFLTQFIFYPRVFAGEDNLESIFEKRENVIDLFGLVANLNDEQLPEEVLSYCRKHKILEGTDNVNPLSLLKKDPSTRELKAHLGVYINCVNGLFEEDGPLKKRLEETYV